jgi:membrane protein implicated in regulation of membrane protease activity
MPGIPPIHPVTGVSTSKHRRPSAARFRLKIGRQGHLIERVRNRLGRIHVDSKTWRSRHSRGGVTTGR